MSAADVYLYSGEASPADVLLHDVTVAPITVLSTSLVPSSSIVRAPTIESAAVEQSFDRGGLHLRKRTPYWRDRLAEERATAEAQRLVDVADAADLADLVDLLATLGVSRAPWTDRGQAAASGR